MDILFCIGSWLTIFVFLKLFFSIMDRYEMYKMQKEEHDELKAKAELDKLSAVVAREKARVEAELKAANEAVEKMYGEKPGDSLRKAYVKPTYNTESFTSSFQESYTRQYHDNLAEQMRGNYQAQWEHGSSQAQSRYADLLRQANDWATQCFGEEVFRRFKKQNPAPPSDITNYNILGITPNATPLEITKAYRHMISKNHPDKVASNGGTETEILAANEKTKTIIKAYGKICEERNIT